MRYVLRRTGKLSISHGHLGKKKRKRNPNQLTEGGKRGNKLKENVSIEQCEKGGAGDKGHGKGGT